MKSVLLWAAALASVSAHPKSFAVQPFGTAMERKCNSLSASATLTARYVDGSCFVGVFAEEKRRNVNYTEWLGLNRYCSHMKIYKGHLAHVGSVDTLRRLVQSQVARKSTDKQKMQYFVGGRQNPRSNCTKEYDGLCNPEDEHQLEEIKKDWFWVDESGQRLASIDSGLWRTREPNNGNGEFGEYVVALEDAESDGSVKVTGAFGLNDVHPTKDKYNLLCQYDDFLQCDDGFTLVGDLCYQAIRYNESGQWMDFEQADSHCGSLSSQDGSLASVHSDSQNKNLALFAQMVNGKAVQPETPENDDNFLSYIIGLSFSNEWSWTDGSRVDYFRWWGTKGKADGIRNGYHARLRTATNDRQGVASFAYWETADNNKKGPFICQHTPRVVPRVVR